MMKYVKEGSAGDIFFPICEKLYLHKKLEESQCYRISHLIYPHIYSLDYGNGSIGITVECKNYNKDIVRIRFNYCAEMPKEWVSLGITWQMSYKDIWMFMKNKGFENIVSIAPSVKYTSQEPYLNAEFVSISPDSSFSIIFKFDGRNGNKGTKSIFDQNTLFSIVIE